MIYVFRLLLRFKRFSGVINLWIWIELGMLIHDLFRKPHSNNRGEEDYDEKT